VVFRILVVLAVFFYVSGQKQGQFLVEAVNFSLRFLRRLFLVFFVISTFS